MPPASLYGVEGLDPKCEVNGKRLQNVKFLGKLLTFLNNSGRNLKYRTKLEPAKQEVKPPFHPSITIPLEWSTERVEAQLWSYGHIQ